MQDFFKYLFLISYQLAKSCNYDRIKGPPHVSLGSYEFLRRTKKTCFFVAQTLQFFQSFYLPEAAEPQHRFRERYGQEEVGPRERAPHGRDGGDERGDRPEAADNRRQPEVGVHQGDEEGRAAVVVVDLCVGKRVTIFFAYRVRKMIQ